MRWWRNNTDTWSYSICALGPGPKSIVISSPPHRREWEVGGVPRVLGHHSAGEDFLEGSKNRGCFKWHLQRTYLLPGPRLPCSKFDVPCDQLVSSCKGPENIILVLAQGPLTANVPELSATFQLPSSSTSFKIYLIWNFVLHFSFKSGETRKIGTRKCLILKG